MTDDQQQKPSHELSTQQRAAAERSAPLRVSGKLKAALDDMVWNGTPWNEAAEKVNFRVRSMRMAMGKPHVLKYLRGQRGIVLAQSSGRNLHRLAALRDQDDNRAAAVQAARALEGLASEQFGAPSGRIGGGARAGYLIDLSDDQKPGLTIVIHEPERAPAAGMTIDVTPNAKPRSD